jgi:hypothetical protein
VISLHTAGPILHWKFDQNVFVSSPYLKTAGYDMQLMVLNTGQRYQTRAPVIVNVLRGSLRIPALQQCAAERYESPLELLAEEDSLLFLCYDNGDNQKVKDELKGLALQWIEPAEGCFRTDSKIEIEGIKINLWYLVPDKNGGIHNHAKHQGHNEAEQFVEWHTQLRGNGCMVKYKKQDKKTEYERIPMQIGRTHALFSTVKDGVVTYPWHAYVAGDKGALFIAFEDMRVEQYEH